MDESPARAGLSASREAERTTARGSRRPHRTVDDPAQGDDDQGVSGGSWRERSRIEPWPAPPPRRGPGPVATSIARLLKLTVALAVVVAVAGGVFWLLEDEQG